MKPLRIILCLVCLSLLLTVFSGIGTPALAHTAHTTQQFVPASIRSISGCRDSDYQCGYQKGFADARVAKQQGLCGRRPFLPSNVASEQGYTDAFEHYCRA